MASRGIDYGLGRTNIDKATGIRYGVISVHAITQAWYDSAEADYGSPTCPKCQREADEPSAFGDTFKDGRPDDYTDEPYESDDYVCVECRHFFGSESAFGDEPLGWYLKDAEYEAVDCLDSDVMVIRSPFYTFGPYCSPCVPGGITLYDDERALEYDAETGNKAYCFGHDWFDEGKAPYRVYRVEDDSEVLPEAR